MSFRLLLLSLLLALASVSTHAAIDNYGDAAVAKDKSDPNILHVRIAEGAAKHLRDALDGQSNENIHCTPQFCQFTVDRKGRMTAEPAWDWKTLLERNRYRYYYGSDEPRELVDDQARGPKPGEKQNVYLFQSMSKLILGHINEVPYLHRPLAVDEGPLSLLGFRRDNWEARTLYLGEHIVCYFDRYGDPGCEFGITPERRILRARDAFVPNPSPSPDWDKDKTYVQVHDHAALASIAISGTPGIELYRMLSYRFDGLQPHKAGPVTCHMGSCQFHLTDFGEIQEGDLQWKWDKLEFPGTSVAVVPEGGEALRYRKVRITGMAAETIIARFARRFRPKAGIWFGKDITCFKEDGDPVCEFGLTDQGLVPPEGKKQ